MWNLHQASGLTRRPGAALLCAALLLCGPARAAADDAWLVLPSTVGDGAPGESVSRRAALILRRDLRPDGARIVDPVRSRDLYEQRGSSAPMMFSHSDLDALARDTQMALYHVASGLPAKARRDVERALARANRVLESLNRESLAAQHLLDACLYLVRAHMQGGRRGVARQQALECRRLVPDIEPDGTTHPPDVIGLLAEAEAYLRINQPGALRVESDPQGCAVYVNGRRLGTSPLELSELGPGEYRLQAECVEGQPGRVHRVQIGSTRVIVRIDTVLDKAVRTQTGLGLGYQSVARERSLGARHAVEVGRVVGATHVLWVATAVDSGGRPAVPPVAELRLLRVDDQSLLAVVNAQLGQGSIVALDAVRKALMSGHGLGPVETSPSEAPPPPKQADQHGSEDIVDRSPVPDQDDGDVAADGADWLAPTAAITGSVVLLAGWGLWLSLQLDEQQYAEQVREERDHRMMLRSIEAREDLHLWVGVAGAAMTAVAIPLSDLRQARSLWWATITGAVGIGLLATGIALTVSAAGCDDFDPTPLGRCTDTIANSRLGPLLVLTSAPLLSLPLAYLLRPDETPGIAVGVSPYANGGAVLVLRGSL